MLFDQERPQFSEKDLEDKGGCLMPPIWLSILAVIAAVGLVLAMALLA